MKPEVAPLQNGVGGKVAAFPLYWAKKGVVICAFLII